MAASSRRPYGATSAAETPPIASELLSALRPVLTELDRLGVRYHVGGSVASSHHGAARSTLDVDVTAAIGLHHALSFMHALKGPYYVSRVAIEVALRLASFFNLIHLRTAFTIDLFISKGREFDEQVLARATLETLNPDEAPATMARIATAEDIILLKLEWYRLGNGVSERQWRDGTSVAKLHAERLDGEYLRHSARLLEVEDLLERLLLEVGGAGKEV